MMKNQIDRVIIIGLVVIAAISIVFFVASSPGNGADEITQRGREKPLTDGKKAAPSKATLIGTVKDGDTERPVRRALVKSGFHEVFTDEMGRFELVELSPGKAVVDVIKVGYPVSQTAIDTKGGINKVTLYVTSTFRAPAGPRYSPTAPRVVRRGNHDRKQVALTFDDGWHPDYRILELLEKNDISATVFIIGGRGVAEKHQDFIERMDEDGFEVATHGYSHYINTNMTDAELTSEIRKGQKVITDITHKQFPYFRCPGGLYNSRTLSVIAANGYQLVLWSIDSQDTYGGLTTQQRLDQIIKHLQNGAIIVFHFSGHNTYELLSLLIPKLYERGYEITTVSELLKP